MKFLVSIAATLIAFSAFETTEAQASKNAQFKQHQIGDVWGLREIPHQFKDTGYEAAFDVIATYNQVQDLINGYQSGRISAEGAAHAIEFIARPCLIWEVVHDAAYAQGAVSPRYPRADFAKAMNSPMEAVYAEAFIAAESIMADMNALFLLQQCTVVPNNKCCDKSGALDKCKDSTKFCELTGSIDNCTSSSQNC